MTERYMWGTRISSSCGGLNVGCETGLWWRAVVWREQQEPVRWRWIDAAVEVVVVWACVNLL